MPKTRNQVRSARRVQKVVEIKQPKTKAIGKSPLSIAQLRTLIRSRFQTHSKRPTTGVQRACQAAVVELLPIEKMGCPVCLEPLLCPTLTECGHAFCLPCAEESLKHKPTCPLCRKALIYQQFKPSLLLKSVLEERIEQQFEESEVQAYKQRTASFEQKEAARRVSKQLKIGDFLDFWNERKWKEGRVLAINTTPKGTLFIVQATREGAFSEPNRLQFHSESRLIAKHRTFTREAEVSFLGRAQFRIQIFDFRESLQQSLFLSMMDGGRRMEVSLRDQEGEDSLMRFAMSFDSRNHN